MRVCVCVCVCVCERETDRGAQRSQLTDSDFRFTLLLHLILKSVLQGFLHVLRAKSDFCLRSKVWNENDR